MKEILLSYKDRLINLNGKNRTLVCRKLHKKRAFDIKRLDIFEEELSNKIVEYLISRSESKLTLVQDYTNFYNTNKKLLEQEIEEELKAELLKIEEKYKDKAVNGDKDSEEEKSVKIAKLKKKYKEKLEKELNKLGKKRDALIDCFQSLKTLSKEISDINKETGRYELYIGYPFVEGNLKDDTFVKSPLFLFPITLTKECDTWAIQNISNVNILLNKVLLLSIAKHNEIRLINMEMEYQKVEISFIEDIIKKLEGNNIIINNEMSQIEAFKEDTKDAIAKYNLGQLTLVNNLVIGQFSIANSIYNDYEELLERNIDNNILEGLLKSNSSNEGTYKEVDEKLTFKERDLNLISNLDYSQEKAVNMVNETDKLVIYGPPGTGKSQTITNIIGDALSKDKKILMVSQKRAALDVIYNRLSTLNKKAILIHDANGDKKNFYSLVSASLENMESENSKYKNDILKEASLIDRKIEALEKIALVLHTERDYGLTLQEMYSKCKAIVSREDKRYDEFIRFRQRNVFSNYKYIELKDVISKINEEILECFKEYKNLSESNPYIDDVDINMNLMDISEFQVRINNIINPIKSITSKSKENKEFYEAIMKLFSSNLYNPSENQVDNLAIEINEKVNGNLLDKINTGKWWSISYWLNYSANKEKENKNREEFEARQRNVLKEVKAMALDVSNSLKEISIIKKALNDKVYNIVIEELLKGEDLTEYFNDIVDALNIVDKYKKQLKVIRGLDEIEIKILEYSLDNDINITKNRVNQLLEFITLHHVLEAEKEIEVQDAITFLENFEETVSTINDIMNIKRNNLREFILNKWNSKIQGISCKKAFKEFKRQANKKKALLSIRKYMDEYCDMVLEIFPCFLLSPETVSEILPLKKGLFDIVIFDEASQMYIENAIPSIYRGKQVVIAGDDKQLRPNSTFSNRYVEEEDEDVENEKAAAFEEESLLDLAKVNYNNVYLTYHYRSKYEELINFSNYAFYGGRLKISPNISRDKDEMPIERVMVNGSWRNRENIEEAEEVADLVGKILKERKNNESIGIITFNINQKNCIENMLERKATKNSDFKELYIKEIDRVENNEDISLFVKNIENVQGDERDIIIFSIAYAKNENGRVSANFGALSQDGGENRLNVAISRARSKIYVVTSIEPEELVSVENTKNNGPKLFKKYLQYVREISEGNKEGAQKLLNSLIDSDIVVNKERIHDSDFEAEVHTQIGVSGYKIDLAIYDKKTSRYVMGIECDGATYHSSKSARERDIHRQRYLESRGWKIIRIWSKHWWDNPKKEIERICSYLNK